MAAFLFCRIADGEATDPILLCLTVRGTFKVQVRAESVGEFKLPY